MRSSRKWHNKSLLGKHIFERKQTEQIRRSGSRWKWMDPQSGLRTLVKRKMKWQRKGRKRTKNRRVWDGIKYTVYTRVDSAKISDHYFTYILYTLKKLIKVRIICSTFFVPPAGYQPKSITTLFRKKTSLEKCVPNQIIIALEWW